MFAINAPSTLASSFIVRPSTRTSTCTTHDSRRTCQVVTLAGVPAPLHLLRVSTPASLHSFCAPRRPSRTRPTSFRVASSTAAPPSAGKGEKNEDAPRLQARTSPWKQRPAAETPFAEQVVTVEEENGTVHEQTVGSLIDEYVGWCNEHLAVQPYIHVERGVNDMPCVRLWHPNGSEAVVYLHGACVTSWTKPNGADMLYLVPHNKFDGIQPIKGGIPLSFPQYRRGVLPTDGFLQDAHWSLVDSFLGPPDHYDPAPAITLYTESSPETKEIWPFDFEAFYTVTLREENDLGEEGWENDDMMPEPELDPEDDWDKEEGVESVDEEEETALQLRCRLEIRNTDTRPFSFTSGLRTHFATRDLSTHKGFVRTLGLGGKYMYDWAPDPTGNQPELTVEDEDYITFGDAPIDRLYVNAESDKGDVLFCPGDRTHFRLINKMGFRDVGAWHPVHTMGAAARNFVALPAARLALPVKLYPGEVWTGEMVLNSYERYWETPIFDTSLQPIPVKKGRQF